ncbi:MAG: hypothetical protein AMXMBFR84_46380 [Candidatus Hydrogenedentota bacterium]
MNIGVMSDTHGNRKLMHEAADRMLSEFKTELIIHAGDNYSDAEELGMTGLPVRMVPGLWCDEYHNPRIPKCIVDAADGITFAVAHTDKDLRLLNGEVAIAVTGHTHVAEIRLDRKTVYLNPGHLKSNSDRNQTPSFAVIRTTTKDVEIAIHELRGGVRTSLVFHRTELA